MEFFAKTGNGKTVRCFRENLDNWGGPAYTEVIRKYLAGRLLFMEGNITIDLKDINRNLSAVEVKNVLENQLVKNGSSQEELKTYYPEFKKVKPIKISLDSHSGNSSIEDLGNFLYSSKLEAPIKKNLFEDLQDDEVVVNIEELADLFAREVLEIEQLGYESNLERYKFLVSKYSNFIKEVRKHES
jgi:hypothetical protein